MSKLSDLLHKKSAGSVSTPATPPAQPATPSGLSGLKRATQPHVASPVSANASNGTIGHDADPTAIATAQIVLAPPPDMPRASYDAATVATVQQMLQAVRDALVTNDVSEVLKNTLVFLRQNPQFAEMLLPEEIGLLTQAAYQSQAIVISQKVENSTKRTARKTKNAEVMNDLADLDISL